MADNKYKRILLKLSGEALAGDQKHGLNKNAIKLIAQQIVRAKAEGIQIAIVTGGGNFWRGRSAFEGMDHVTADNIGMIATVMNSLAVADTLNNLGHKTTVMSAVPMNSVCMSYTPRDASRLLDGGEIVIIGGGTGNPFFTTDTAAALRAVETKCDIMMKATNVDGVYDKNPKEFPDAKLVLSPTFDYIIENKLDALDAAASVLCRDKDMPLLVFNMTDPENIGKALFGENIGTLVLPPEKPKQNTEKSEQ
ncbi:MAG: UMP kinase [Ruminococcus sp.]|jgi:uridylate kinase|nr:UMP kinase [Ruminococcus sp.]